MVESNAKRAKRWRKEGGVGVKEKKARGDGVISRTSKRTERGEKESEMGEGGLGNKSGKKERKYDNS